MTYYVIKPNVLWVILATLVTAVTEYSFDLVFFLILNRRSRGIHVVRTDFLLKLFEILNIVIVIGDLAASTGDADLIRLWSRLFLLFGAGAIVGVGV